MLALLTRHTPLFFWHQYRIVSSLRDFLRCVCEDDPALEEQLLTAQLITLAGKR
ncbi:MAG: hypothetical protein JWN63_94 [Candidatus Acidoferrum typicum]|nr:hypothetical protein [Candidatus Acidoferrum typicum]